MKRVLLDRFKNRLQETLTKLKLKLPFSLPNIYITNHDILIHGEPVEMHVTGDFRVRENSTFFIMRNMMYL